MRERQTHCPSTERCARQAAQGDAEVAQCRTLLTQRTSDIRNLERRCDELEAEARLAETARTVSVCLPAASAPQLAHSRAEAGRFAAQCERLNNEKTALVDSVKQLSKEVSKLDAFKRSVLKTLNDENVETHDHARDASFSPAQPGAPPVAACALSVLCWSCAAD